VQKVTDAGLRELRNRIRVWPYRLGGRSARVPEDESEGRARADGSRADEAMDRYAVGEDAAFAELYDLLAPRLYGYLLRQTRERARAEDLVQQTFFHMHKARGRFIRGAEVTPWAFAIARRLLIDGVRRSKREVLSSDGKDAQEDEAAPNDAADDVVYGKELAGRIQKELQRLPETQRVAFELVKQEGLSLAEAAEVLGTTVTAVKLRAHRAYEALRVVLGEIE
jgi:RNA polymerase sigma-70 factor (ECF subfamily)